VPQPRRGDGVYIEPFESVGATGHHGLVRGSRSHDGC
jgi:hypothetical protein